MAVYTVGKIVSGASIDYSVIWTEFDKIKGVYNPLENEEIDSWTAGSLSLKIIESILLLTHFRF